MEREMIQKLNIPYKGIYCGKLRRYFSWENFLDILKIPVGIVQAILFLLKVRPHAVFCKGGFVSFPVAVAGWILRIPVLLHESDVIPGLANRMSARFAKKICIAFEETKQYLHPKKTVLTGIPVSSDFMNASASEGKSFSGLPGALPVLLFMGGSQGADFINKFVWEHLDELLKHFEIIHLYGKGKMKNDDKMAVSGNACYRAFSYVDKSMKHIYAFSDLIISRSGASTLAEIDYFQKPAILIPLSKKASRGEQILNAEAFIKINNASILPEDEIDIQNFLQAAVQLLKHKKTVYGNPVLSDHASEKIIQLFMEYNLTK